MTDILLLKITILLSIGIFILPKRSKVPYSIILMVVIAGITSSWAIEAWQNDDIKIVGLDIPFWGGTPSFVIDKLSSFFILVINFTSLTGIIYGSGYLKPYQEKISNISLSLHVWAFLILHLSMLLVVTMRGGFTFLMAWEMMSMSSFILVIFEGTREENLKTGIKYLVQMHAGFTFLLLGFLWVSDATGIFGFDAMAPYFASHSNWAIFLVMFLGFGIKAGFVPLHTWLPHAHPAAPSHVSGVMSGVMIKMGIYGILRVLMDIQSDFLIIGSILIGVSIVTGIMGILYASFQKDMKKLLAYSSIENIGIIGLGMGIAVMGQYLKNEVITTLALTGSMLHILNHSLYKSMLFYTAGNVYYSTHTRDLDKLGGIIKWMPVSGLFFLVGSLSICAIPPFNGFISEFLIYNSVFQTIGAADFFTSLMILVVVLSLVVIGGLSVYSFTKAFGLSFLGNRRGGSHHGEVKEVPLIMCIPGMIIIFVILSISLMSPWAVGWAGEISGQFYHLNYNEEVLSTNIPIFQKISLVNLMIFAVAGILFLARNRFQRKEIRLGTTWGCGYSAGDFRHQYTSTSYSHYLRELSGPAVDLTDNYLVIKESEIFPGPRKFETTMRDVVEEKIIIEPVEHGLSRMIKIGWAQTGKINHYLIYPLAFLMLIMLLTFFGLI